MEKKKLSFLKIDFRFAKFEALLEVMID